MKSGLLVLSLVVALILPCAGQIYVGPVAGGQFSWTKFDNSDLYETYGIRPVWGFHAGASVSLKVRNRFFLHSSLVYSTKGRTVVGKDDELLRNKVVYNFIEMPIIYTVDFRATLGSGKEFKYFLGIGPNVSYWLGGRGTLYNSDLDENADFAARDLKYKIVFRKDPAELADNEMTVAQPNRVQLGLNLATGFVFDPLPDRKFMLLLRYELGHSFLAPEGNGTFRPTYYQDVLQSRNKGLRLSVSYVIDLRVEDRKKGRSTIRRKKV